MQPPSGGCVLKRLSAPYAQGLACAAAFGRLCVETKSIAAELEEMVQPPSGGCVLKLKISYLTLSRLEAAAFGRLCVETSEK